MRFSPITLCNQNWFSQTKKIFLMSSLWKDLVMNVKLKYHRNACLSHHILLKHFANFLSSFSLCTSSMHACSHDPEQYFSYFILNKRLLQSWRQKLKMQLSTEWYVSKLVDSNLSTQFYLRIMETLSWDEMLKMLLCFGPTVYLSEDVGRNKFRIISSAIVGRKGRNFLFTNHLSEH